MENELRMAVLIDSDNVSEKYVQIILEETANIGTATYKRIYGDWTSTRMKSWKGVLLDNSITPMQQYSYTVGKNATDSAMIIDAMDILYSHTVDGFCLVSSDSDFTRLAVRLREEGMMVIGMGESKTPQPFIAACNQFKYLDLLLNQREEEEAAAQREAEKAARKRTANKRRHAKQPRDLERVTDTLDAILEKFSDDDGWMFSGRLGDRLSKRLTDFDVRNFGFNKFSKFMSSMEHYEMRTIEDDNHQKQIYFRIKPQDMEETSGRG